MATLQKVTDAPARAPSTTAGFVQRLEASAAARLSAGTEFWFPARHATMVLLLTGMGATPHARLNEVGSAPLRASAILFAGIS